MNSLPDVTEQDHILSLLYDTSIGFYSIPEFRSGMPVDEMTKQFSPSFEKPLAVFALNNELAFTVVYSTVGEQIKPQLHYVVAYKKEAELVVPCPHKIVPSTIDMLFTFFSLFNEPVLHDRLVDKVPSEELKKMESFGQSSELAAVFGAFILSLRDDPTKDITPGQDESDEVDLLRRINEALQSEDDWYPHSQKTFTRPYVHTMNKLLQEYGADIYLHPNFHTEKDFDELFKEGEAAFVLAFKQVRFAAIYRTFEGEGTRLQLTIDNPHDSRLATALNHLPNYTIVPAMSVLIFDTLVLLSQQEFIANIQQVIDLNELEVRDFRTLGKNADILSVILAMMVIDSQSSSSKVQ